MTAQDRTPRASAGMLPAYGICTLTLITGFVWCGVTLTHLRHPGLEDIDYSFSAGNLLLGLGLALSGTFLLARGSGRALGGLLLCGGCATALVESLAVISAVTTTGPAATTAIVLLSVVADCLSVFTIYALPLWLPDERLPRNWGVPLATILAAWTVIQRYDFAAADSTWYGSPNPLYHGLGARLEGWITPWYAWPDEWAPVIVIATTLTVMAVRWWRSPGPHRGYAILVLPYLLWIAAVYSGDYGLIPERVWSVVYLVGAAVWPVALGFAHARNRTWHLDRSARRILTAFLLVTALTAAYVAGALLLSSFALGPLAPATLLLSSLAVVLGAFLRPIARRTARLVDRWFYGERAQPYQAVRDLAERLSRAVEPEDAPRLLCVTVTETLGLPGARLVVHTRGGPRQLTRIGAPHPVEQPFPLTYQGEVVGHLYAPPRTGEEALDNQDREALRILADHAAPAIASLRLYQDLQTSREHVVLAREEERRRLRHDLHDGLGPALSGLRLQIDAVRAAVTATAPTAGPLRAVSQGIGQAITELRHITDGLAPAALDGADLTRALQQLAGELSGRTLRVTVALLPCPLPPLSAAMEVAVYRIAAEALNNAVRHSHADHAHASVTVTGEAITVTVTDNGRGFTPQARATGLGLRSMAERSEELGGRFALSSTADGTSVQAVFPARPAPAPAFGTAPSGHFPAGGPETS
ncbi:hypothetical protein ACZ90_68165 [Streptomyces albus subsp. albus]|nr:hypothetical protein ACZ90_68165 [Streptomyces albus subsp. albus]